MAATTFQAQRVYVKKETAFADNTYQSLAAGDAVKALSIALNTAHNRTPSREKRSTPDYVEANPRMSTTGWNLRAQWKPSGTIGTESDLAPLFEALMGSKVAAGSGSGVTTTVSASPTPTVNGCTVASATGLAIGDVVVVTTSNGREATRITNIATAALTWSPPLSAAPASGAAVVAGVTYGLTTAAPPSLAVADFLGASKKEASIGSMADSCTIEFAKSEEVVAAFSGGAAKYIPQSDAALVEPGTQTTVGASLNGLVAKAVVNGYAFKVTGLTVQIKNNVGLRDQDLGDAYATEAFRADTRNVELTANFYLDDDRIRDLGTAESKVGFSLVLGDTNGRMLAVVFPAVLWSRVPHPAGESGSVIAQASGMAYATATGNDSVALAEL